MHQPRRTRLLERTAPPDPSLRRRAPVLRLSDAIQRALSKPEPNQVMGGLDSVLSQAWARDIDAFLTRRRPPEVVDGVPGSCDSSEATDTSTLGRATSRTLKFRSAQRLRRMLESRKSVPLSDFMTYLEHAAVFPKTEKKYADALARWTSWTQSEGLSVAQPGQIDQALVQFFNHLFFAGQNPWRGECLVAAILHKQPHLGKLGSNSLPRALRCLRGWRRLCPSRTRVPYSWDVWCAVAAEMARLGLLRMAIAILVGVDAYLRPSELVALTAGSLVPPSPESGEAWSLLLHPASRGARSKVGESDETIMLNSPRLAFLKPALEILARSPPDTPLWPFDYSMLYRTIAEVGKSMNIALVPYIMRHSGVTIDRAENARSVEECQKRGRWKQPSSMRRYEKSGRLGDSWRLLGTAMQTHCKQMRARITEFLVGGARPPRLPVHRS
jgi:hypothetical protein